LQINDLIALDNTDPGAALPFERNDFHATDPLTAIAGGRGL
jgi:hypothetical protein